MYVQKRSLYCHGELLVGQCTPTLLQPYTRPMVGRKWLVHEILTEYTLKREVLQTSAHMGSCPTMGCCPKAISPCSSDELIFYLCCPKSVYRKQRCMYMGKLAFFF